MTPVLDLIITYLIVVQVSSLVIALSSLILFYYTIVVGYFMVLLLLGIQNTTTRKAVQLVGFLAILYVPGCASIQSLQ